MHGESCRLVDHQHQPVAIQQPRHHLFRANRLRVDDFRRHGGTAITDRPHHDSMARGKAIRMNDNTAQSTEQASPWWQRLAAGLKRSSSALGDAIADLAKRPLDEATIQAIEDELIRADLGIETAGRIAGDLRQGRFNTAITADEIKQVVAAEVEKA